MNAPVDSDIYVCGPQRLIDAVYSSAQTLGIEKYRLHAERFSSAEKEGDKSFNVQLSSSKKTLVVSATESVLEAMEDAGVKVEFDCRVGNCGMCAVKVIEGNVEHRDNVLSDIDKAEGFMCVCVSRAMSETLVLDI